MRKARCWAQVTEPRRRIRARFLRRWGRREEGILNIRNRLYIYVYPYPTICSLLDEEPFKSVSVRNGSIFVTCVIEIAGESTRNDATLLNSPFRF